MGSLRLWWLQRARDSIKASAGISLRALGQAVVTQGPEGGCC